MAQTLRSSQIELVLKITKHCNLRCSYCYEFPYLAQKGVVSLEQFDALFRNVAAFDFSYQRQTAAGERGVSFIWHGGEPFMVPLDYYESIGDIQRRTIGRRVLYENAVQTNLTILTEAHVRALKEQHFFTSVGFSFDVYGGQRVDVQGRATTDKVLGNLQRLRDEGVATGGIAVLSRSTLASIGSVYKFYESLDLSFRILPYHIENLPQQTTVNGLHPSQIAAAMCEVFDLWFQSETPVTVAPLETYTTSALRYLAKREPYYFDKARDESIFVVDFDGSVSGYETYLGARRYGNLFTQTFTEIAESENRAEAAREASARVDKYCSRCRYFGACSGYPVAESNPLEESWLATEGCYVARIIDHIVDRIDSAGLSAAAVAAREVGAGRSEAGGRAPL